VPCSSTEGKALAVSSSAHSVLVLLNQLVPPDLSLSKPVVTLGQAVERRLALEIGHQVTNESYLELSLGDEVPSFFCCVSQVSG
jgi:hypothetical protein